MSVRAIKVAKENGPWAAVPDFDALDASIAFAWRLDYLTLAAMVAGFIGGTLAGFSLVVWG
jgi:hypothetical protein